MNDLARCFVSLVALLLLTPTILAQETTVSEQAEWVELFDGQSIKGWIQRGGKAKYEVVDGAIVGTTVPNSPNSFLCTPRDYSDFQLTLEFKVHPELNSGVQIRSLSKPDYRNGRVHGYQVEIDPSIRSYSAGIYDEARRGWLNRLNENRSARYAFRQDDWNELRIEAIGNRIRTWINGVPAADLTDDMTDAGFIGLQVHGVGGRKDPISVQWRNIRIRETSERWPESDQPQPEPVNGSPFVEGTLQKIQGGFRFLEGPAVGPDGMIYFNDIPNNRTHIYDPKTNTVSVFREPSNRANGMFWTPNDYLISCEGGSRQLTMLVDGKPRTLASSFEGKKLNSPNDLVLDEVGGIYFTDPRYGNRDDMEMEVEGVYYQPRNGKLKRVAADLKRPNGIILSPDNKTLYVADLGARKILAYDAKEGVIENKRDFAPVGSDGMSVDAAGNIYCTFDGAVIAFNPSGDEIGRLKMTENPANCLVVGSRMYITARSGFYVVEMKTKGLAY